MWEPLKNADRYTASVKFHGNVRDNDNLVVTFTRVKPSPELSLPPGEKTSKANGSFQTVHFKQFISNSSFQLLDFLDCPSIVTECVGSNVSH